MLCHTSAMWRWAASKVTDGRARNTGLGMAPFCRSSMFGGKRTPAPVVGDADAVRSEEHTSELQSLMRISYAVFCLKKKRTSTNPTDNSGAHILYTARYKPLPTHMQLEQHMTELMKP